MTDISLHLDPDAGEQASIFIDWREGFCDRIDVEFIDGWMYVRFNGHTVAKRFEDDEDEPEDDDLSQFDDHVPPI